jgi:hypothetical protein
VLFKAKIKSLESIQRVTTGRDDSVQSDLIGGVTETTNSLAIVTPYQVSFVSFTPQLADVVNGFAQSPHCFLIKSLNITTNAAVTGKPPGASDSTGEVATPGQPATGPTPSFMDRMRQRYGPSYGGSGGPGGGLRNRYGPRAPEAGPLQPGAAPGPPKRGPETLLEEVPLRAVMQIDVVKVLPPSERGKYKAAPVKPKASGQESAAEGGAPASPEAGDTPSN